MIYINIKNLYKGQIIKNYQLLCKILGITPTTGYSKIKQLNELALYCNYKKEGNKFIIIEVYNNIDPDIIELNSLIRSNNSKYIKLLSNILLEYIYNNKITGLEITLMQLMELLNMININYKHANNKRKELSQLYNIQLASIYFFYDNTRSEFKKIIERVLNNLKNKSVIFWTKCIMIVDNDNTYKANNEQEEDILNMQKQALNLLECNTMQDMLKDKNKIKEFNKIIKKELTYNYYFAYSITIGSKAVKLEYEQVKQDKEAINNMMRLKANKMHSKNIYLPYYNDYTQLIDILINKDTKDISNELKEQHKENNKNYNDKSVKVYENYCKNLKEVEKEFLDTFEYKKNK